MALKKLIHLALQKLKKTHDLDELQGAPPELAHAIQNAQREQKQYAKIIVRQAGLNYVRNLDPLYRKVRLDTHRYQPPPLDAPPLVRRQPNIHQMIDGEVFQFLQMHPYSKRLGFTRIEDPRYQNLLYVIYRRGTSLVMNSYQLEDNSFLVRTLQQDIDWLFGKTDADRLSHLESTFTLPNSFH